MCVHVSWPLSPMQVSSFELEKIRTVKAAMNRLQTRIARVKQELETILDDNQEMMVSRLGLITVGVATVAFAFICIMHKWCMPVVRAE